jgi:uncharacterized protein
VAYGVPVTRERLERVDRAESAARAELAGLEDTPGSIQPTGNLRVRDLGEDRARLEVDPGRLATLVDGDRPTPLGQRLVQVLLACGFAEAEIDPRGFRSGSMNELLPQPELFR